jgi:hypothetical protein
MSTKEYVQEITARDATSLQAARSGRATTDKRPPETATLGNAPERFWMAQTIRCRMRLDTKMMMLRAWNEVKQCLLYMASVNTCAKELNIANPRRLG